MVIAEQQILLIADLEIQVEVVLDPVLAPLLGVQVPGVQVPGVVAVVREARRIATDQRSCWYCQCGGLLSGNFGCLRSSSHRRASFHLQQCLQG
jgi:hypothetical protein